ncbi:MAG: tryptophan--tRNA ligase, partial [Syntrophomonadaceae bacterium]|nr:tryptophan--tRNA ligase [Syntrophomonadaceae bacterium]
MSHQSERLRVLSGMRPTGRLHLGHLSVLENWAKMQEEYDCYFFVANWHALTTAFEETENIPQNIRDLLIDWLSVGIDPEKSTVFIQSQIKEHAELYLLLSMITPISWLERCPTFKDQVQQLGEQGKDINTHGFLGYPVLMAADVLIYKSNLVPVGEDQLPHLEMAREIARRFNHLYGVKLFTEPKALLAEVSLLPGVDGRKMSKSYGNDISISASRDEINRRVNAMVTDPSRIHKTDPGHPEVCTAHLFNKVFRKGEIEQITSDCKEARIGCVACKRMLADSLNQFLAPFREKRRELEANPQLISRILRDGAERARQEASRTLE